MKLFALATALFASISFSAAGVADAPFTPDNIWKVRGAAMGFPFFRQAMVEKAAAHCGTAFPAMSVALGNALAGWHGRNDPYVVAAAKIQEEEGENMVREGRKEEWEYFKSKTIPQSLQAVVEPFVRVFTLPQRQDVQEKLCADFLADVNRGKWDVEVIEQRAVVDVLRKYVSTAYKKTPSDSPIARYSEKCIAKVKDSASTHIRKSFHVDRNIPLRLTVTVLADGGIEKAFVESSGSPELDKLTAEALSMLQSCDPFPNEISKTTDVIKITRTWVITQ